MDKTEVLADRFAGTLVGSAIGDVVGAALEGSSPGLCSIPIVPGRYTDDTDMMMGVAESLLECGGFDADHMALVLMRRYFEEPWRGYGSGSPRIFEAMRMGRDREIAAREIYPGGSYGNGGAMRVAPVALVYRGSKQECFQTAARSAKITHTHPLGVDAAVLQASAVTAALDAKSVAPVDRFLKNLTLPVISPIYRDKISCVASLLRGGCERADVVRELGNGVEGFRSVPTAVYCFLANHGSFEKAILYALSLGGDTDTIAAMTGAMAGAYHGLSGISPRWLQVLQEERRGTGYLVTLSARLMGLAEKLATG